MHEKLNRFRLRRSCWSWAFAVLLAAIVVVTPAMGEDKITIKTNLSTDLVRGTSLADAMEKIANKTALTQLSVTAGEITTEDWKYLKVKDENYWSIKLEEFSVAERVVMDDLTISYLFVDETNLNNPNPSALQSVAIKGTGKGVNGEFKISGFYTFWANNQLSSVVLPSTLTELGKGTFYVCTALESITLPTTLKVLGEAAFYKSGLKSISIPEGVTKLNGWTFFGCSALRSVSLPNSLTSLGEAEFDACTSLETITIPEGVTQLLKWAFYRCTSLRSVGLPSTLTTIEEEVFSGCNSLESVVIPEGVTQLSKSAFYGCTSLRSVELPSTLTTILDGVFFGCNSLESVVIPDAVTTIGSAAFGAAPVANKPETHSNLKFVVLPKSLNLENKQNPILINITSL